jgi:hypothetical protein
VPISLISNFEVGRVCCSEYNPSGLRAKVGNENIVAILELRSNTMKSGVHQQSLVDALSEANQILILVSFHLIFILMFTKLSISGVITNRKWSNANALWEMMYDSQGLV